MRELVDKLQAERRLEKQEWIRLIRNEDSSLDEYIFEKARAEREFYI